MGLIMTRINSIKYFNDLLSGLDYATFDLIKMDDTKCSICFRELPNKDMKNKKGCDWCVPKVKEVKRYEN